MPRIFVEFDSIEEAAWYLKAGAKVEVKKEEEEVEQEKPKAEKKAEPKKKPAKKKVSSKESTKSPASDVTFGDVKNAITELSGEKGVQAVKDIFTEFDVRTAKELSEDKYAEFIAKCEGK